jgi:hypothetical protein
VLEPVAGLDDHSAAAVVHREAHDLHPGPRGGAEDVLDLRPAEAIDGLGRVADPRDADARRRAADLVQDRLLHVVRVLVLVDQHLAHGAHLGADVGRLQQGEQVVLKTVVVGRGVPAQGGAVERPQERAFSGPGGDAFDTLDARFLRGDLQAHLVSAEPHHVQAVFVVVDGEAIGEAGEGAEVPEHLGRVGVERAHPDAGGAALPDAGGEALAHLVGGLVREREGRDGPRGCVRLDQLGDALDEHAGFPGTGAGEDQHVGGPGVHGLGLGGVEVHRSADPVSEELRRRCHQSTPGSARTNTPKVVPSSVGTAGTSSIDLVGSTPRSPVRAEQANRAMLPRPERCARAAHQFDFAGDGVVLAPHLDSMRRALGAPVVIWDHVFV